MTSPNTPVDVEAVKASSSSGAELESSASPAHPIGESFAGGDDRPLGDTPWRRFRDEQPAYDGLGERHLLTWSVRVGTYDIGCIDGQWSAGEAIEGHPDDLWCWLDVNPERHLIQRAPPLGAAGEAEWALVPREPRVEMLAAFWRMKNTGSTVPGETGEDRSDYAAYRAMLAAAPPAESGADGGEAVGPSPHTEAPAELTLSRLLAERREMLEALKIATQLAEQVQLGNATPLGGAKLIENICRRAILSASSEGKGE